MNIIQFIRANKGKSVEDIASNIRTAYVITTSSKYLIFYEWFKNHFGRQNTRRLVELLKFINFALNQYLPTASVENIMTRIRTAVKDKYGFHSIQYSASLKNLVFNKIQKNKNREDYAEKIKRQNNNSKIITLSQIEQIFADNTSDTDFRELLTYILLNSGCRFQEAYTGVFTDMGDGLISMSNIAKTIDKTRVITKEVLDGDSSKFIIKLNLFRRLDKNKASAIIQLNAYLKAKYNITSHTLRKYYANVSFYLQDKGKVQKINYLADVLGHSDPNIAQIYSGFTVRESD